MPRNGKPDVRRIKVLPTSNQTETLAAVTLALFAASSVNLLIFCLMN
jgi:hypothetical protein